MGTVLIFPQKAQDPLRPLSGHSLLGGFEPGRAAVKAICEFVIFGMFCGFLVMMIYAFGG